MLPTTLLSVTMLFLVHHSVSSPVYTMQPAYITANIGASTGRNIRRLPCVSRKSGMTGTCMFAIDCLKSNGTHLGTCIDRFYFGSCCHIEPSNDLSSNVIDTAIMPDRQPPYRMSSTTEKVSTAANTTIPSRATTVRPADVGTTTSTSKTITTMTRRPSPSVATTEKLVTTQKVPPSEVVTKPRTPPTTTTTTVADTRPTTTTESFRLSTFQSVEDGTEASTIKVRPSSIKVTAKPAPTKPRPTVKPTQTPRPVTRPIIKSTTTKTPVTVKPTRPGTTASGPVATSTSGKPIRISPTSVTVQKITTLKPSTSKITTFKPGTTKSTTVKPSTTKSTTLKPSTTRVTTLKPSTTKSTTLKPSTTKSTTLKPSTTRVTTLKPSTTKLTTVKPSSTSTSGPSTTKLADALAEETRPPTTAAAISNEVLLTSTNMPLINAISGNTATNEIIEQPTVVLTTTETTTTQGPGLVTWGMVNSNEQTTRATVANNANEDADEWTPITPPDGWVLLPSVSTTTAPVAKDTPTTESVQMTTPTTTMTISEDVTTQTTLPITTSSSSETADTTTTAALEVVPLMNTSTSANTQETTPAAPGLPTDAPTAKPVNMSDHTDVCGRRMYPEPRIVGGEKSSFGKWPWQISLRQWKTSTYLHKCGAALLNENWAITAAHCVENVPPSDLLLRLGEHDLSTDSEPYIHQERRVQIVASHPQFDPRTFEYDLALLRFYEPVQFQPNIIPVCVPQDDESFVGRSAFVTGWGRLYEDGPLPSVLQEVSVPVINNTVCESMYRNAGYIEHIPNIFICAGWKHGGFDSCEGDSGGPMVIQRPDKRFLLAGIISWGIGCAEPNQPGVYTRISEFREWINQILQF